VSNEFSDLNENITLKLSKGKLYKVTDRANSLLNQGENFKLTNDVIKIFLGRHGFILIDFNLSKLELSKIEKSFKSKEADDLLNF